MKKALLLCAVLASLAACQQDPARTAAAGIAQSKVDPFRPKPFPGNWVLGQVAGIAVDKNDNIWIVHRRAS